jgi:hypothetical protein
MVIKLGLLSNPTKISCTILYWLMLSNYVVNLGTVYWKEQWCTPCFIRRFDPRQQEPIPSRFVCIILIIINQHESTERKANFHKCWIKVQNTIRGTDGQTHKHCKSWNIMTMSLIFDCNMEFPFKLQIFILLWYISARTFTVLIYYFESLKCCM